MRLTTAQSYALLEKFGCYVIEACDKCGRMLGPVRFTCRGEGGVWCSRECRGDAERPLIPKGGRRRKHKTNAERQRAYREVQCASLGGARTASGAQRNAGAS